MLSIGLFGTCDNNRWRDSFMTKYDGLNIPYFNPMVDNWHPGLVADEAKHLAEDEIILKLKLKFKKLSEFASRIILIMMSSFLPKRKLKNSSVEELESKGK
jgi:hypothetical protein